jgi:hypothetical protein
MFHFGALRWTLVGWLALVGLVATAESARAHPSEFRTLTLDFIIGVNGLEAIDAAVVPTYGPSYEPFISVAEKQAIALDVLEAIGISPNNVTIEAAESERYHQVGFTVRTKGSEYEPREVQVQSKELQALTKALELDTLRLSVCSGTDDKLLISASEWGASRSGRESGAGSRANERPRCVIWELAATDPPLSFPLRTSASLPGTGVEKNLLVIGCCLLLIGWVAFSATSVGIGSRSAEAP